MRCYSEEEVYAGPDLTNYRLEQVVVNFDTMSNCPPPRFVDKQRRKLEADLEVREAVALHEASLKLPVCLSCLANIATRVAAPCGHVVGCVECCLKLVRTTTYYQVDEGLDVEEVPLPIRCPRCMSLVGDLIRIFWN